MKTLPSFMWLISLFGLWVAAPIATASPEIISLAGDWNFSFSITNQFSGWQMLPAMELCDTIQLPSTTDTQNKGSENTGDCGLDVAPTLQQKRFRLRLLDAGPNRLGFCGQRSGSR